MSASTPNTPRETLNGVFAALDLVIDDGLRALERNNGQVSASKAGRLAVAMRGTTLLQAGQLLLEEGHWEVAAGVARQMFELLINVEHLLAQPDEDAAWADYKNFAMAADLQARRRAMTFAMGDGYQDSDDSAADLDECLALEVFDQFRDRHQNIRDSWSGKSAYKLAEQSSRSERLRQYQYYYRTWSAQAHAGPSSIIESLVPHSAAGAVEDFTGRTIRETLHLIAMLILLFSDLVIALDILAPSTHERISSWRQAMQDAIYEWRTGGRGEPSAQES
ncbi:DUF5677 domain-containing protein [Salinibacterium sp. M195]|uniref:DUF5677 domain-containing protein n=1 Tax=Salinibacterium sp. M195 TaxID=2583374 RepID=UPI001C627665|nr:DUF5677 domain-containing protein [Salinibacterium sp. M195]QYH34583.1 hypothetical protein FFT87_00660 [Salinibacterium sp. M195]